MALMSTEDVTLRFENEAVREIARVAALVNKTVEVGRASHKPLVPDRVPSPRVPLPHVGRRDLAHASCLA
jgi:hypothetical protein